MFISWNSISAFLLHYFLFSDKTKFAGSNFGYLSIFIKCIPRKRGAVAKFVFAAAHLRRFEHG